MVLADFQSAYGADPIIMKSRLISAIQNNQAPLPKWDSAFKNAKLVLTEINSIRDTREYNYEMSFGGVKISSSSGKSYARKGVYEQDKTLTAENDKLKFRLFNEEVSFINICF